MKRLLLSLVCTWAAGWGTPALAIIPGPFGPHGEGGTKNGQTLQIGAGGSVYELDAFLNLEGQDLNGAQLGTSAQLSRDALPAGLALGCAQALSADQADLVLTYSFTNTTAAAMGSLRFFVLLDAEIDQAANTFFNEYGTLKGVVGRGAADGSPDQWQIDEPGFLTGTLYRNLFLGSLSNSNAIPQGAPNDTSLALGFTLGSLPPGGATTLRVMISENGRSLGSLALVQRDLDPASKTFITLSGGLTPALEGAVYVDASANARFDLGEGVAGAGVSLWAAGAVVQQTKTDADGRYSFTTVPPGTYNVQLDTAALPSGSVLAVVQDGAGGNPAAVTLVGGSSKTLNFGFQQHPLLGGRVFVDANTNSVFDPGERALAGVKVQLLAGNVVSAQTATDSEGHYAFGNLSLVNPPPGSYVVQVDPGGLPAGATLLPAGGGVPTNAWPQTLNAGAASTLDWLVYQSFQLGPLQIRIDPWMLNRTHGSLLGTVRISNTNAAGTGAVAGPYRLGLHSSTNFFFARPDGTNQFAYVDLTAAVKSLAAATLNPGQTVVLTNAIEVYSRTRGAPADSWFEWVP